MILAPSNSFEKFNYLLRPSKQVERKIFIEAFHYLVRCGFPICDYTYVGFGSVYYADFILFHKYLYINKMICVEWSDIPHRMRFNKPYKFIRLALKPASEVAGDLNGREKYLVWLDYDRPLDSEMLEDIDLYAQTLAPGSLLLITVDAEPRLPRELDDGTVNAKIRDHEVVRYYRNTFGRLLPQKITQADLTKNSLPVLYAKSMLSQLATSLAPRALEFNQLFNFRYADNAQMLTLGGMICDEELSAKLAKTKIYNQDFIQRLEQPTLISVPPLTVREKQWLDSELYKGFSRKRLPFEIKDEQLAIYWKYYRHYPTYYESLV